MCFTLISSDAIERFKSTAYISAEKHCGVSKWTDKLPSRVSVVNHEGMLIYRSKKGNVLQSCNKHSFDRMAGTVHNSNTISNSSSFFSSKDICKKLIMSKKNYKTSF